MRSKADRYVRGSGEVGPTEAAESAAVTWPSWECAGPAGEGHSPSSPLVSVTVAQVMISAPKTLDASASVSAVRAMFDEDHVHMALLVAGVQLVGALIRSDVLTATDDDLAVEFASLEGRTIDPDADAEATRIQMVATGIRRLAVVSHEGELLGLLCLKRHRHGFCSDADVAARALERELRRTVCIQP